MTTAEEAVTHMTPVAGGTVVAEETPAVSTTPETVQPAVQQDGTVSEQDARAWAFGIAAQHGWAPAQAPTKEEPRYDSVPGTTFPLPEGWEQMAQGERDAYKAACQLAEDRVKNMEDRLSHRFAQLEGSFSRDRVLQKAQTGLDAGVREYFDEAVRQIERENGAPIAQDHPMMARIVQDRAKSLYMDSGAWKRNMAPGDTASSTAAPAPVPQNLKDAYGREFDKDPGGWRPKNDQEWRDFLTEAGHVL